MAVELRVLPFWIAEYCGLLERAGVAVEFLIEVLGLWARPALLTLGSVICCTLQEQIRTYGNYRIGFFEAGRYAEVPGEGRAQGMS